MSSFNGSWKAAQMSFFLCFCSVISILTAFLQKGKEEKGKEGEGREGEARGGEGRKQ